MPILSRVEECMNAEERAQRQLERLQSTLNRAHKNVPFYRNRFEEQGIDPSRVESLADLGLLPFTERKDLSENYPYGLFAVPLRDVVRIHTARGTAHHPTVSGYTKGDVAAWREMVARALTAAGVGRADILQIDLDAGLANWGRDYKEGAEAIETGVIPLTMLPPEKQLMILRDYKTSVLVTSASGARLLVREMFRSNLNANAFALKTLILVGGAPGEEVRAELEARLHARTWVHYGLSDVPGAGLAFECEERSGLHVNEDHFLAEVIDPVSGARLGDGEPGELVLTTLSTRAVPLIRFRTGDRVRFVSGTCACGRTLRRMAWSSDRTDGAMVIRGVIVYPQQIDYLLEKTLGYTPSATRFHLRSHEERECLEVWLKVDEKIFSDEIKEMERLALKIGTELYQELGISVKVRFKESGSF